MWLKKILPDASSKPVRDPFGPQECQVLADALGDTPESATSVHLLRRGLCDAYAVGDPANFDAAIVQKWGAPNETFAFGTDAGVLWDLLRSVAGWRALVVPSSWTDGIRANIEGETEWSVTHHVDPYYTLNTSIGGYPTGAVRQLTMEDLHLLESAPAEVQGEGFESPTELLEDGVVAGAVVSNKLVAIAHTCALTDKHGEIGVHTLEQWRGRGFSTAAAAIVAQRLQEQSLTPVWRTRDDNPASIRVAQKLGFTEVSSRDHLILS